MISCPIFRYTVFDFVRDACNYCYLCPVRPISSLQMNGLVQDLFQALESGCQLLGIFVCRSEYRCPCAQPSKAPRFRCGCRKIMLCVAQQRRIQDVLACSSSGRNKPLDLLASLRGVAPGCRVGGAAGHVCKHETCDLASLLDLIMASSHEVVEAFQFHAVVVPRHPACEMLMATINHKPCRVIPRPCLAADADSITSSFSLSSSPAFLSPFP
ncbi:hypothetical protein K402DRAFT_113320 [Aulographum hederae CBS 113979]|uniref:Uncharacterized protein n=1 Tax=Aulographum hederae CBS 113979 TaxID=1176131 RepID=A0A6G1GWB1_9PEZI|nr:hypothetical protein K402DRAFT_113320 [Aulographum hederae CBS 113979]